jgi:hypothetical protein
VKVLMHQVKWPKAEATEEARAVLVMTCGVDA